MDKKKNFKMKLSEYDVGNFERGASRIVEAIWYCAQWLLVSSWIPGSWHRRRLLRLFGAEIGEGVILRPRVRIKFPWRLRIGDHSWIGEGVWIDNLAEVAIGDNVCVSQGAYFCTGSHNWSAYNFELVAEPIMIEAGCWIAAFTRVGPGVTAHCGAVLTLGSCAYGDLDPLTVYSGVPATATRTRKIVEPANGERGF